MKITLTIFLLFLLGQIAFAQEPKEKNDRSGVERACLDYIEGFYEGDTAKLIRSLQPSLYKIGYWKNTQSGKYEYDGQMTYREAIDYARKVGEKKAFAKPDAPKKVEILDMMHTIASAKVTAKWGVDYILLAKQGETWKIGQVVWEGPLAN